MVWQSTEEIVTALKIDCDPNDRRGIRSAIRKRMAIIHPDRTAGSFTSPETQEEWQQFLDALEFLDSSEDSPLALIPAENLPTLVEALTRSLAPPREGSLPAARGEFRAAGRSRISRHYRGPRVGSAVFAAICGGLFTGAPLLVEHPAFRFFVGPPISALTVPLLLVLFLVSGTLFLLTWVSDNRDTKRLEALASDRGIHRTLAKTLDRRWHSTAQKDDGREMITFRLVDLVRTISEEFYPSVANRRSDKARRKRGQISWANLILAICRKAREVLYNLLHSLDEQTAEELAKLHIQELTNRRVVNRGGLKGISTLYELDVKTAEEIVLSAPKD